MCENTEKYGRLTKMRRKVFNIIQLNEQSDRRNKVFDLFILILIIINTSLIIIETFDGVASELKNIFHYIEIFTVIVFTIEYLLRIWTANYLYPNKKPFIARIKFVFSPMAILDLLAILPFFIPFIFPSSFLVLRTLRVLRLFRLFKINRYSSALSMLARVFKKKSPQLVTSMLVLFILIMISSVLMYEIEHQVQPEVFQNALSTLWWSVVTLTSVGYGDYVPITMAGRLLGGTVSLLGVALIALPTGILSAGLIDDMSERKAAEILANQSMMNEKMFVADEILKLKKLLDNGILTQAEFETLKLRNILDSVDLTQEEFEIRKATIQNL